MRIIDTATDFVENYESTLDYLNRFYKKHEEEYAFYFERHCRNVVEKKHKALLLHPEKLDEILPMRDIFFEEIDSITKAYEAMLPVRFTQDVHLFVGLYGSNAFTYRQYNPEVGFCLEKLSGERTHIQVIVAHEFGHAAHHIYNDTFGTDWEKVDWMSPLTWLLQEGIATYLSKQVVQADFDEYFAYEKDQEWMDFAVGNESLIAERFLDDLQSGEDIFKEWFSINGGAHFGFTRLAYYLGYKVVEKLAEKYSIEELLTLWVKETFKEEMLDELRGLL
ncbi:DUF5700 domain-containing putative Zn-dependent protease [Jeotgalibacillus sp. R-1-5s-1]|uniref:DUF5700 domain-containing putative Zn-dependent protease n=1 Tax=Jeotgalibacillus sp. R-1-5s-1 TaxID=2555897 RepID=UPI00106CED73|nr:DUF5700 domain-containing putative Zn-dependent protease [Jeotgalibacillus sp. R-1-5s-1]TFD94416.1 hypothetical protein E2491_13335 [Jeotgalibacillus sp. R-1-5s-1]